jgi:hypothetical protein
MPKPCKEVTIKVNMENAAFEDYLELPRILHVLADKLEAKQMHFGSIRLLDINGNTVGEAKFKP